ncbi:MAG: hypothetical protein JNJ49_00115 [Bdellovibrionaceae bacterium]|nr:hypothetical protein [Pseudobdellovibrionaceae bacterium]
MSIYAKQRKWRYVLAGFLAVFGIATLKEGAAVLFFDSVARAEAGNYVPFVLWFNFLAGFAYVVVALAIARGAEWGRSGAAFIAGATAIVFVAFGLHILSGGLYEMRTLIAMSLRTSIWLFAVFALHRWASKAPVATSINRVP